MSELSPHHVVVPLATLEKLYEAHFDLKRWRRIASIHGLDSFFETPTPTPDSPSTPQHGGVLEYLESMPGYAPRGAAAKEQDDDPSRRDDTGRDDSGLGGVPPRGEPTYDSTTRRWYYHDGSFVTGAERELAPDSQS